jgi:hypothetical protein
VVDERIRSLVMDDRDLAVWVARRAVYACGALGVLTVFALAEAGMGETKDATCDVDQ